MIRACKIAKKYGQETYLSIYGTIDTARQANAAHVRYNPGPTDTVMPNGTVDELWLTAIELAASVFFIITVHSAAPTNKRKLPRTERDDDTRKATVCFKIPLTKDFNQDLSTSEQNGVKLT